MNKSSTEYNKYSASLTGEPFLFNETRALAIFLVNGEDFISLRKRNLEENLIMHKKQGSLKRVNTPLFRRLAVISQPSLKEIAHGDAESAKILLLISIAKTDRLVGDFIFKVYADKVSLKYNKIEKSDIERYFETVYEQEPYLRGRTEQTKAKLKQQLVKILAEAGLIIKTGQNYKITPPQLTNKLKNVLVADGDSEYIKILGNKL